jgi:NADPH:quinone reductase-like Zn-dependent oxidoreductase
MSVVPVPDVLPDTIAGQAFVNPLTAYGMIEEIKAKPDEWILQTTAGSVLGQMTIQLAKYGYLYIIQ